MTELDIQKTLFDAFNTLNEFSGIEFIKDNVAYLNKPFTVPYSKRWFELNIISDRPETTALMNGAPERWNGFLQVDICTPLNKGEDEAGTKYEWLSRLFSRGKMFGPVIIKSCYIAHRESESDHYRMVVRIEFTADLNID